MKQKKPVSARRSKGTRLNAHDGLPLLVHPLSLPLSVCTKCMWLHHCEHHGPLLRLLHSQHIFTVGVQRMSFLLSPPCSPSSSAAAVCSVFSTPLAFCFCYECVQHIKVVKFPSSPCPFSLSLPHLSCRNFLLFRILFTTLLKMYWFVWLKFIISIT